MQADLLTMTCVETAVPVRGMFTAKIRQEHSELTNTAQFEVVLMHQAHEMIAALKQHSADHPVHEFDFSLARLTFQTAEKFVALISRQGVNALAAVPVLKYDSEILLLINYIRLPEDAMAALLTALQKRFHPATIRTQRNYNNYSIFGTKTEFPDGFVASFDAGFETYFNALSKKTRFNLRYYHDRLRASFPSVEIEFIPPGKLQTDSFAQFIDMVGKRYNKSYWIRFLEDAIFAKFRDSVSCTIVRIDGKMAAFNIFYVFGNSLIFTGNTFDGAFSKYSLGFLTTFWSIQHAALQGFAKVILGPGDFGYKSRLSNAKETLYQYSLH